MSPSAGNLEIDCKSIDQPFHQTVKLSVVVPIYNEPSTLEEIVKRLLTLVDLHEIILVNDGSDRETTNLVNDLSCQGSIQVFHHQQNRGKGAAIRTGFAQCTGNIIAIQDADLEYDPTEIAKLILPIAEGKADIVYGSRFLGSDSSLTPLYRRFANQFLTWVSNRMTGLTITDMETCYKVMKREVIECLDLQENRFGIEPEMTAKLAKQGWRIEEVPISYQPRGYNEGKKIGLRDGIRALWCIWKYSK